MQPEEHFGSCSDEQEGSGWGFEVTENFGGSKHDMIKFTVLRKGCIGIAEQGPWSWNKQMFDWQRFHW